MALTRYRHSLIAFGLLGALIIAEQARAAPSELPTSMRAAAAPAAAASNTRQPLEVLPSGHPVVRVSIDGAEPKRFVIDTAASSTTIMPKLRASKRCNLSYVTPTLGLNITPTKLSRSISVLNGSPPAPLR
jgi:hypothetical protein